MGTINNLGKILWASTILIPLLIPKALALYDARNYTTIRSRSSTNDKNLLFKKGSLIMAQLA